MNDEAPAWAEGVRDSLERFIGGYHRHEIIVDAPLPSEPALIVGNHGFGGVFDLNVLAMSRALRTLTDRGLTYLVHQVAWTTGFGWLVEPFGCLPASAESAVVGFSRHDHVVVFPGGDIDAAKPWKKRNQVHFGGRSGFARLAVEHGVPVVPVVTAGAGESLLVLTDGQGMAARLGLPKWLRVKALPVSLALPWGLNIGVAGMAPYLPLPSKLVTAVLPSMSPDDGEDTTSFALRIEQAMQARMDELVAARKPLLG